MGDGESGEGRWERGDGGRLVGLSRRRIPHRSSARPPAAVIVVGSGTWAKAMPRTWLPEWSWLNPARASIQLSWTGCRGCGCRGCNRGRKAGRPRRSQAISPVVALGREPPRGTTASEVRFGCRIPGPGWQA